ncbi:putative permease [Xenococcus sp. PCC 7305]|uniref:AI-2E family transporter n=1 Tax=Xenococcus sp. PCC 7305 TaxID=102125 RepID=UPI0002AC6B21|nr:AI-2E family transporter [Xenococcus sp. PCC 7305]ELS03348.1 putative permease [Xenococcus sp. PCC 7305]
MNFGTWVGFIVFFVALYVLWQIRQLLLLIFTAVVIATSLNILVNSFCRRGVKRVYGVLLSILLLLSVISGFFWIIVPSFVNQFQQLAQLIPQGVEKLNIWLDLVIVRLDPEIINYLPTREELAQQLQPLLENALGGGLSFFYGSLGVLLSTLLLLVITFMILGNPTPYRQGFIRLFPAFYRHRVDEILELCDTALQGWLVGILFNMCVIAILSFIGLSILGIPLALAQAVLAGILTFIPNLGPFLSVLSPMAIALLDAPWKSLAVLILYLLIQQIEGMFLTPFVMEKQVSLLPAIALLSQIFFTTFFGFLGLFLALPLTIVGQVWFKEVVVKDILDPWQKSRGNL